MPHIRKSPFHHLQKLPPEVWLLPPLEHALAARLCGGGGALPSGAHEWLCTLLLGASLSAAIALTLTLARAARVASLCVLAAEGLLDSAARVAPESFASLGGGGARTRAVAVAALAATGCWAQLLLYLQDEATWALPAGSVLPAPLRRLVATPLEIEHALERVATGGGLRDLRTAALHVLPLVIAACAFGGMITSIQFVFKRRAQ